MLIQGLCAHLLSEEGAWRIHGGGFGGSVLALVPVEPRSPASWRAMDRPARLPGLPRGGRGRPRRAGEAAAVSGAARGAEGASEYAVDERGNPFWTYEFSGGAAWRSPSTWPSPRRIRGTSPLRRGQPSVARRLRRLPAGEGEAAAATVEGDAREGSLAAPTTCDLCWEPSGEDGLGAPAALGRARDRGRPRRRALGLVVLALRLLPRASHRGVPRAPPHGHRPRHHRAAARFLGRLSAVVHRLQRRSAHRRRLPSGPRPLPRRRPPLPR